MKKLFWRKYLFEFLSIFIAVIAAFLLNNWNDNRKDKMKETKILAEISNGLTKDIEDITHNVSGHKDGINACNFWRRVIHNEPFAMDSIQRYYLGLTRDFVLLQNVSGYETLKSKGLELVRNDSLRFMIISLYEYDYTTLRKLEEDYYEMQYQRNYFPDFNRLIAPAFVFNEKGMIENIRTPLKISSSDKNILLSYLWKIEVNRKFILQIYGEVEEKIRQLRETIDKEVER